MATIKSVISQLEIIARKLDTLVELLTELIKEIRKEHISSARITPRAAEGGTCRSCAGKGEIWLLYRWYICNECNGSGKSKNAALR